MKLEAKGYIRWSYSSSRADWNQKGTIGQAMVECRDFEETDWNPHSATSNHV